MEGKGDFEQASLGYEAENILIDDIDEEMVIDFSSLEEPKVFPYASGAVNHDIGPPEGEISMCECTPMVGDSLDQVISFHYPSQFDDFQFEYDAKGKRTCFWINHGHKELPQLLILCDLCPEFEPRLSKLYVSEYKDKSAFLRTIWGGSLLLHARRNLLTTTPHCYYSSFSVDKFLFLFLFLFFLVFFF